MRKEYDFSKGNRGALARPEPSKVRITIRLDADIVAYFKEQVRNAGGGNYQTMINAALRGYIESAHSPMNEETIRRILREELKLAQRSSLNTKKVKE